MSNNRNRSQSRDRRDVGRDFMKHEDNRTREKRERSPINRNIADRDRRANNGKLDHSQMRPSEASEDFDANNKKKIASKCRLFVGNLTNEVKDSDLKELFGKFGEVTECFLSSKGFGFVRLSTRACAEMAKENIDGMAFKGRNLRVRYAVHGASLKISELNPFVSNELLYQAFSMFGEVERAVHILDEKSQPTGEGVVEYERKPGAVDAMRRINDGVFLLSSNPRPIFVEPLDPKDDEDGLMERMIPKTGIYQKERMFPPRFALPGSFEFEFGNRWKELYRVERLRREQLDQELKEAREKLEGEMELAFQEFQAAQLREDLRRRQDELERLEASRRERMEVFRIREEERTRVRQQQVQQMPPPQNVAGQMQFAGNFQNPQPPFGSQFGQQQGPELRMGPDGPQMMQRGGEPAPPPSEEQLSQVQKLMQMMSQQAQTRGHGMPPGMLQQQMGDGAPRIMPPMGIRPMGMPQFQEERGGADHRRSAAWQGDQQLQERSFRFRS